MNELQQLLAIYNGDKNAVADLLGLNWRQIYRLLNGEQEPTIPVKKLIRFYLNCFEMIDPWPEKKQ